jgi:hypothetical protein
MRLSVSLITLALLAAISNAQNMPSDVGQPAKARVFITDSKSWEMVGGGGGSSSGFGGGTRGGARPQTAEIIKTFGERCPDVVVNNKQEKADYVVLLDHESGKGLILHDNKVAVFNKEGDSIVSHSTRSLGNAVKDACEAITNDWPARRSRTSDASPPSAAEGGKNATVLPTGNKPPVEVEVVSTPSGADIEIDGSFVGNTPSTLGAAAGQHQVVLKKKGFQPWERKISIVGGHVKLDAELEIAK